MSLVRRRIRRQVRTPMFPIPPPGPPPSTPDYSWYSPTATPSPMFAGSTRNSASEVQIKELRSKVAFLQLQFDSKQADEFEKPDVKIVVQDARNEFVYAHKIILSKRSPVFCKMFNTKMLEEETGIVRIYDATIPVIHAVVKFCYDAEITFTDEVTGEDVLEVSHKYEIPLLLNTCEEHLMETLNNDNLARRLKLAKKFGANRLETAATYYLKNHFDSVIGRVITELC